MTSVVIFFQRNTFCLSFERPRRQKHVFRLQGFAEECRIGNHFLGLLIWTKRRIDDYNYIIIIIYYNYIIFTYFFFFLHFVCKCYATEVSKKLQRSYSDNANVNQNVHAAAAVGVGVLLALYFVTQVLAQEVNLSTRICGGVFVYAHPLTSRICFYVFFFSRRK